MPARTELTFVTYNSHAGRDEDGRPSLREQARELADLGADVIAVQEVDRGTARSGGRDQLRDLAALLGMPHTAFAAAMVHDGGLYGNAVLARRPIVSSWHVPFRSVASRDHRHIDGVLRPWPQKAEPRCAVLAQLHVPSAPDLTVGSVHLSLFPAERARAAADLVSVLPAGSAVLGLDLNTADREEPVWQELLRALRDTAEGFPSHLAPTYPASDPGHGIDAVLARGAATVACGREPTRHTDHCAVWAKLDVTGAALS